MPWYRQGTVAVTAGQNSVTGTGTSFSANGRVGDAWQGPDGRWYEVTNIASDTVLSILPAYQGATVSGGTYALAPMQGYVKESADRLRQLVDQFGGVLAMFGTPVDVAGLRANIGAAARGANGDITALSGLTTALSVAQGGTGGKTQADARAGLGLKTAAVSDIVGTVSQSGGVPTGAIVEKGSNANGKYTKFADGTMICHRKLPLTSAINISAGAVYYSGGISATAMPAAFSEVPTVTVSLEDSLGISWITPAGAPTVSNFYALYLVCPFSIGSRSYVANLMAVGRWY